MDLIPDPRRAWPAQPGAGAFPLDGETVIEAGPGTEGVARWFRTAVGAATGLPFADDAGVSGADDNRIVLGISPDIARELGPEGYRISVDAEAIRIEGGAAAGVFWGRRPSDNCSGPTRTAGRRSTPRVSGPYR